MEVAEVVSVSVIASEMKWKEAKKIVEGMLDDEEAKDIISEDKRDLLVKFMDSVGEGKPKKEDD
jgi:hypothetical protein